MGEKNLWYNIDMFGRLKPAKPSNSRSIDGMRSPRATDGEVVLDAQSLPWIEEEVKKPVEDQKSTQQQKLAMQRQNRIINFFNADQVVTVTPEEIVGLDSKNLKELKRERINDLRRAAMESEEPKASARQRGAFLRRLARDEITEEEEAGFLLLIRDPLNDPEVGPEKMFEVIVRDPRQTQILARAAGLNASNWQKVDQAAMSKILRTEQKAGDFRTPVGFKKLRQHFLRGIRPKAKEQLYRRYVQSMNELERTLYGERLDYYLQFELMRKEALSDVKADSLIETAASERRRVKIEPVTAERAGEMLGRAVIDGDPWRGGNLERHLSTHNLAVAKLGPVYEVSFGTDKVYLSNIFQLTNGVVGVMAYVPDRDSYRVRSFYRESNQALWRYLPDYVRRGDGGIDRFCFGQAQESVTLPLELQEALVKIEREHGVMSLVANSAAYEPEFFLTGTAHAYETLQEYQTLWSYGRMKGDYYTQVSRDAINHDFGLNGLNQKKAPYTLSIDYNRAPDFDQQVVEFELDTVDAGRVTAEGFLSHDGQYSWLFCRDARGRAWVDYVEVISPLTSTGLRRDWAVMGDFATKLYEHSAQAGIYGDRNDTRGAKQCMWNNYLSNVPLIREYVGRKNV